MAGVAAFYMVRGGAGGGGGGGRADKGLYKPKCKRCQNFFIKDGEGFCLQGRVSPVGKLVLANGSMIPETMCAKAKDMRDPGAPCGPYGNQFLEREFTPDDAVKGFGKFLLISGLISFGYHLW